MIDKKDHHPLEEECELCGVRYSGYVWPYQLEGMNFCVTCSHRLKPVIHYYRLVKVLASQPCENGIHGPGETCKCHTCTARGVRSWHSKYRALRTRGVSGQLH